MLASKQSLILLVFARDVIPNVVRWPYGKTVSNNKTRFFEVKPKGCAKRLQFTKAHCST